MNDYSYIQSLGHLLGEDFGIPKPEIPVKISMWVSREGKLDMILGPLKGSEFLFKRGGILRARQFHNNVNLTGDQSSPSFSIEFPTGLSPEQIKQLTSKKWHEGRRLGRGSAGSVKLSLAFGNQGMFQGKGFARRSSVSVTAMFDVATNTLIGTFPRDFLQPVDEVEYSRGAKVPVDLQFNDDGSVEAQVSLPDPRLGSFEELLPERTVQCDLDFDSREIIIKLDPNGNSIRKKIKYRYIIRLPDCITACLVNSGERVNSYKCLGSHRDGETKIIVVLQANIGLKRPSDPATNIIPLHK